MVLVFTCTLMIHGDLGPDKFERSAWLLGIYKFFRSEGLITKLRWQTRGGRLPIELNKTKIVVRITAI